MTILVSNQAVPPTFYNKIAPMVPESDFLPSTALRNRQTGLFSDF